MFASADLEWMDYGLKKKLVRDDTRVNLLGNRLVLIAPKDTKIGPVKLTPGFDLAKLVGDGRIATGEVKSVPVGRYAMAALQKLGICIGRKANAMARMCACADWSHGEAPSGSSRDDAKVAGRQDRRLFPPYSHPETSIRGGAHRAKPMRTPISIPARCGEGGGRELRLPFLVSPTS